METLESKIEEYKKLFSQDLNSLDPMAFAELQRRLQMLGEEILRMKAEREIS